MKKLAYFFLAITVLKLASMPTCLAEESKKRTGKELFELYCSACHSVEPPPKLAPPVRGIVMNYRREVATREEFATQVAKFVRDPLKEHPKLPEAEKRFGKMPTFPYAEEELLLIAGWMWDTF